MSDPRSPEDGPNWPERDLEENRAEEPGAGWSDDPYRFEPAPPNKPSVEPLEGEWADSEPFDPEPPEQDPFAPAATPRQDDSWGFPPRTETPYEPAPTEPEFEPQPAWGSDSWAAPESEPEPAPEAAATDQPSEQEPSNGEQPSADEAEHVPESTFGYAPEPDLEPAWEPEPVSEAESEVEADPEAAAAPTPEPEAEPTEEVAAVATGAEAADDESELEQPASEPEHEPEHEPAEEIAAASTAAGAAADESALEQPAFEPEYEAEQEPEAALEPEQASEPAYEREYEPAQPVAIESAAATTAFEGSDDSWDPQRDGNRRRPTTAEQAVPWLIGIILALAGMVIVLLALIFSSPNGLVAGPDGSEGPSPTARPTDGIGVVDPSTEPSDSGDPSPSASGEQTPEPTPTPNPTFGALEMTYLGRQSATAPIYLLLRDFSVAEDEDVVAQANQGVSSYANAPDGRVSAVVIDGRAVAIDPRGKSRPLADNIRTVTFGWDAETLYAVRITRDGGDDLAKILEIDFVSGAIRQLATIRYTHPVTGAEQPVREAQFIDDGGLVRLYAVADGNLTLWVLGAPATYRVDPANGDVTEIGREPILWSPDGTLRVTAHEDGNNTALRLRDRGSNVIASTGVKGLVSHIRWAPSSNEIVFTLGVTGANGGVRQDLYVWDLEDRKDPMPLTSSGAAFGAEWRGVMCNWGP